MYDSKGYFFSTASLTSTVCFAIYSLITVIIMRMTTIIQEMSVVTPPCNLENDT